MNRRGMGEISEAVTKFAFQTSSLNAGTAEMNRSSRIRTDSGEKSVSINHFG
jgi:hypothetical protein